MWGLPSSGRSRVSTRRGSCLPGLDPRGRLLVGNRVVVRLDLEQPVARVLPAVLLLVILLLLGVLLPLAILLLVVLLLLGVLLLLVGPIRMALPTAGLEVRISSWP